MDQLDKNRNVMVVEFGNMETIIVLNEISLHEVM